MRKIVITAANSFIGYRLCKEFSRQGDKVIAVVRKNCRNKNIIQQLPNTTMIYLEMSQYGRIAQTINEKCDVAILLAWDGTRGEERNSTSKQADNYFYSVQALENFIAMGCTTIVTAGSQAEYGIYNKPRKVMETDCCVPNTEYGKFKLKLYNTAKCKCEEMGIRLIEPRYFSLYGPDDSDKTMVVSMIRNMLQNKRCELTECIQLWDFLYIDDAVEALIKLLNNPVAEGIYNFGSGESHSLKYYIEIMYKMTKSKSQIIYGAIPYSAEGIVCTNPSIEKLQRTTCWEPRYNFDEGITKVINYLGGII